MWLFIVPNKGENIGVRYDIVWKIMCKWGFLTKYIELTWNRYVGGFNWEVC